MEAGKRFDILQAFLGDRVFITSSLFNASFVFTMYNWEFDELAAVMKERHTMNPQENQRWLLSVVGLPRLMTVNAIYTNMYPYADKSNMYIKNKGIHFKEGRRKHVVSVWRRYCPWRSGNDYFSLLKQHEMTETV